MYQLRVILDGYCATLLRTKSIIIFALKAEGRSLLYCHVVNSHNPSPDRHLITELLHNIFRSQIITSKKNRLHQASHHEDNTERHDLICVGIELTEIFWYGFGGIRI